MPTRSTHTRMNDQRKDHIDPKGPPQRNCPKQLQTHKILTAQIREEIYYSLTSRGLIPDEQKGCRVGPRGIGELLYIDQHILNESKTRRKNLAIAWIDNKLGIGYDPAKLDNKLPRNVQNIS